MNEQLFNSLPLRSVEVVDLTLSPQKPSITKSRDDLLSSSTDEDIIQFGREIKELRTVNTELKEPLKTPYDTIFLTKATDQGKNVQEVEYWLDMPSWPRSDETGVAHVIQVHGMDDQHVLKLWDDMQYGKKKLNKWGTFSTFLNCDIHIVEAECTGVRHCEFLHPSLQGPVNFVSDEWEQRINTVRMDLYADRIERPRDSNTEQLAHLIQRLFKDPKYACRTIGNNQNLPRCLGEPIVKAHTSIVTGVVNYRVSCSAFKRNDGYIHYIRNTPTPNTPINIQYLTDLLGHGYRGIIQYCSVIQKQTGRRVRCTHPHAQGPGKMVTQHCTVKYHWLVPKDIQRTPYVVLASQGVHSHPPPAATSTPLKIQRQIRDLISKENALNLTCSSFKRSQALRNFLQENEVDFLNDVHESLVNNDKISRWIRKERLLQYPKGIDIAGAFFEYQRNHIPRGPKSWIQAFDEDRNGLMIICFDKEQALLFLCQKAINCDLTFKRVAGEVNELEFTIFHQPANRSLTLGRCYVSVDTQEMYKRVFEALFEALFLVTQRPIEFAHTHNGRGFQALIVDMCFKQAEGWGMYLAERYLDHGLKWQEHIEHTVIYCLVHFDRATRSCLGSKHKYLQKYLALPNLGSKVEVVELIKMGKGDFKAKGWAKHKETSWVISGLSVHYTKMDRIMFQSHQRDTNINESSHHKANQMGVQQSLLSAMISGNEIDKREISSVSTVLRTGVEMRWLDNSPSARLQNQLRRNDRKERQQTERAILIDEQRKTPESPTPKGKGKNTKRGRSNTTIEEDNLTWRERQYNLKRKEFELEKEMADWENQKKSNK